MKQILNQPIVSAGGGNNILSAGDMVKGYGNMFPEAPGSYLIGKSVLELLMSQTGCGGLRFYHALGADRSRTLVYLAVDDCGSSLKAKTSVDEAGAIRTVLPIIADRARPGTRPGIDADDLSWGLPD